MLSHFSCVQLFATPCTVVPPGTSVCGIFRQEYWSAFPFPSAEDLPDPGIELMSLMSPALVGGS